MKNRIIPESSGFFVGRVWNPKAQGPSVVFIHDNEVLDITSKTVPTLSALFELQDPIQYLQDNIAKAESLGSLNSLAASSQNQDSTEFKLLAPCDLQAIKACGVTFAQSMLERAAAAAAAAGPQKNKPKKKKQAPQKAATYAHQARTWHTHKQVVPTIRIQSQDEGLGE